MAPITPSAFCSEFRLLTYCGRPEQTLQRRDLVRAAASEPLCWSRFLALTRRHRVVPQVTEVLRQDAAGLVPQQTMDWLEHAYVVNSHRNYWLAGQMAEIVRQFTAARIAVAGLKGPILAMQFYGQLAARQFRDLEILIHPRRLTEAAELLTQMNYEGPGTHIIQMRPSKRRMFRQFYKDLRFYRDQENQRAVIELHWRLTCGQRCFPISDRRLWCESAQVIVEGAPVRCMPAPESIIYIAYDGGMSRWSRLSWLFDLARAIHHPDAADQNALFAAAVRLRAERQLALGCWILRELQIVDELPPVLSAYMAKRTRLRLMSANTYEALIDDQNRQNRVVRAAPWGYRLARNAKWMTGQVAAGLAPHVEELARMGWLTASRRHLQRTARQLMARLPGSSSVMQNSDDASPEASCVEETANSPGTNRRAA